MVQKYHQPEHEHVTKAVDKLQQEVRQLSFCYNALVIYYLLTCWVQATQKRKLGDCGVSSAELFIENMLFGTVIQLREVEVKYLGHDLNHSMQMM